MIGMATVSNIGVSLSFFFLFVAALVLGSVGRTGFAPSPAKTEGRDTNWFFYFSFFFFYCELEIARSEGRWSLENKKLVLVTALPQMKVELRGIESRART